MFNLTGAQISDIHDKLMTLITVPRKSLTPREEQEGTTPTALSEALRCMGVEPGSRLHQLLGREFPLVEANPDQVFSI